MFKKLTQYLMFVPWVLIFIFVGIMGFLVGGIAVLGDYLYNYMRTGSFTQTPSCFEDK
jgi:hypothetical protein